MERCPSFTNVEKERKIKLSFHAIESGHKCRERDFVFGE